MQRRCKVQCAHIVGQLWKPSKKPAALCNMALPALTALFRLQTPMYAAGGPGLSCAQAARCVSRCLTVCQTCCTTWTRA